MIYPQNRLLSKQQLEEAKKLADNGDYEVFKKFLIEKQIVALVNLKNTFKSKTDVEIRGELHKIAAYDIILVDIDNLKTNTEITKNVNGKTVKTTVIAEQQTKIVDWIINGYNKLIKKICKTTP